MTEQLSLSYLLTHPDTLRLSVRHPALLLLLPLAVVLVLLARTDFPRHRLALGLRVVAFTLLLLALAGVALSALLPNDRLSLVALLDVSQSIDAEGRRWEQRYLDQVAAQLAPGDELGVVAFAKEATVVRSPGTPGPIPMNEPAIGGSATDIEHGLETALALLAPDAARRLLLLSDGNETRGTALRQVAAAQRAHVAIYAAIPPHNGGVDVAVEKLVVAPLVAESTIFPVRVVVRNPAKVRQATLSVSFDGELAGREHVTLQPGLNAVEIPYRMTGPGSHRVRAEVAVEGDVVPGNNYREATLMVGGKSRVLLVTSQPRSPLASVLERKDINVSVIPPGDLPAQVEGLLGYHAVIFEDVTARELNARRLDALERYVRDFGGGFILGAGERTYGDTGFKQTALARLLPVTLEPRRPPRAERAALALFILIDRSNSMGYHIRNRLERSEDQSKLVYAKRAALAVVAQLKDTDMVGLIAFDSQAFEVSPLRALKENRSTLDTDIPRLQPGGGTDFFDALESARGQLVDSGVTTKHIVLLTDGDTNRGAADHYPLIAALAKADISVTTIRIGDDTVNLTLLTDISSRTGGQFYHVENVEALPELLLKDTSQALAQAPRQSDTFTPHITGVSQVLRGLTQKDLPALNGYAYARAKAGADVLLYVPARDKKDPLLGVWQYGLGRVVAFTAGLDDDAETWVGWPGFGKLWSQLAHWVMREQTPWDYAVDVHRTDGQATLTIHSYNDVDDGVLVARLFTKPDRGLDVPLVPRAPREFTGRLPAVPGGRYALSILKRTGTRDVSQRTELVDIPRQDEEPQEEFETASPNRTLLNALAAATDGAVDAPVRAVVGREPGTRRLEQPLDWLLIPLAMGLFLADVGLRRLGSRRGEE